MQKQIALILMGSAIISGCHKETRDRLVVVEERYVHQYGMELGCDEWQSRGQNGQVIVTLDNGVVVTKQYVAGTLEGESTFTFPHSSLIEHVEFYEGGVLLKTVYNDSTGNPRREVRYKDRETKIITSFYETLAPCSKEEFRNEKLVYGEYYTPANKIESKIENGSGIKVLRNDEGEHYGEAIYESGLLAKETYFYPNGNPREIIPYNKNGLVDGVKRTFLINGEPNTIEEWSMSQLNGKTTVYKNGDKFAEIPYVKGRKEGIEVRYRDGKTIAEEITWEKDKIHGPYHSYFGSSIKTEWFVDGQRVTKAIFEQQK